MVRRPEDLFPRLRGTQYQVTAPPDPTYNCLAWAAGVSDAWWWPSGDPAQVYWPSGVAREETLEALEAAFATLGYVVCDDEANEPGCEKVAFFATAAGVPTHAARQLANGRWTSKLGQLERIEHALHHLEGDAYGAVALVMKRPIAD
ncbi:MAG TPA: hypothetical protein PK867_20645 [Pirellulales bacterium]|nr:hypothetical protein [Pirellulales bacterium]